MAQLLFKNFSQEGQESHVNDEMVQVEVYKGRTEERIGLLDEAEDSVGFVSLFKKIRRDAPLRYIDPALGLSVINSRIARDHRHSDKRQFSFFLLLLCRLEIALRGGCIPGWEDRIADMFGFCEPVP